MHFACLLHAYWISQLPVTIKCMTRVYHNLWKVKSISHWFVQYVLIIYIYMYIYIFCTPLSIWKLTFVSVVGIQLYLVNVLVCECSGPKICGNKIYEHLWMFLDNCARIYHLWKVCASNTICQCCGQTVHGIECYGQDICGDAICEHLWMFWARNMIEIW